MQYIYTMKGLGKVHPPDAQVLKDIWLSFLPGAKIGVLGLNGAGKSTLLRIMAGEDTEFIGEAFAADGITVGFLHQEPKLDPAKTVRENCEEGLSEIRALLRELPDDTVPYVALQGFAGLRPAEALRPPGEGARVGESTFLCL